MKWNQPCIVQGGSNSAAGTRYWNFLGRTSGNSGGTLGVFVNVVSCKGAGTLAVRKARFRRNALPGAGKTETYVLMYALASESWATWYASAVTVTFTNSSASVVVGGVTHYVERDLTHELAGLVSGDRLLWRKTDAGVPAVGRIAVEVECETSGDWQILFGGTGDNVVSNSATRRFPVQGNVAPNATTDNVKLRIPAPGTLSDLEVAYDAASGAGAGYTTGLQINGSGTGCPSVTTSNESFKADHATSPVAVALGDYVHVENSVASGTPTAVRMAVSCVFTPTAPGTWILMVGTAPSSTAANYEPIGNGWGISNTAESIMTVEFSNPARLAALVAGCSVAPTGATKSWTINARRDGATIGASLSMVDTATSDTASWGATFAVFGTGSLFSLLSTPANTPAAANLYVSAAFVDPATAAFTRPDDGAAATALLVTVGASGNFTTIPSAVASLPSGGGDHWMIQVIDAGNRLETVSFNVAPAAGFFHLMSTAPGVRCTACAGWPVNGATYNQGARFDTASNPGWNCSAPRWIFEHGNEWSDTPTGARNFLAFSAGASGTLYVRHWQFLGPNQIVAMTAAATYEFLDCAFLDGNNNTHGFGGFSPTVDVSHASATANFRRCSFLFLKGSTIARTAGAMNFYGCRARGVAFPSGSGGDWNVTDQSTAPGGNSVVSATAADLFAATTAYAENLHVKSGHEHDWLAPRAAGSTDFFDIAFDLDGDAVPSSGSDVGCDQHVATTITVAPPPAIARGAVPIASFAISAPSAVSRGAVRLPGLGLGTPRAAARGTGRAPGVAVRTAPAVCRGVGRVSGLGLGGARPTSRGLVLARGVGVAAPAATARGTVRAPGIGLAASRATARGMVPPPKLALRVLAAVARGIGRAASVALSCLRATARAFVPDPTLEQPTARLPRVRAVELHSLVAAEIHEVVSIEVQQ